MTLSQIKQRPVYVALAASEEEKRQFFLSGVGIKLKSGCSRFVLL